MRWLYLMGLMGACTGVDEESPTESSTTLSTTMVPPQTLQRSTEEVTFPSTDLDLSLIHI